MGILRGGSVGMKQSKPIRVVIYAVLIFFTLVFLYPVFCMLTMSLMANFELNQFPPKWFPDAPQWSNFKNIIGAFGYYGENGDKAYVWVFLKNTVFIIAAQAVGMVLSMTLCAYGFSKIKFKGRQIAFGVMLATIMIPGSVTMIPLFKEFKDFGWLDTLNPLWIPSWFGGGAMNIFLMRQFMRTIPDTLQESAMIDGAGHLRIYAQIIMPNCKPMIFYNVLNIITNTWGDFFGPLMYVSSKEKWTVGLAVSNMVQSVDGNMNSVGMGSKSVQMATCVIMSLIPLITFVSGQKNYVDNVTLTGIKG